MPFIHSSKKFEPQFKRIEEDTHRNGWRCKIFSSQGGYYKGTWKESSQCGKGVRKLPSGFQYEGDWLSNMKNGFGILSKFDEKDKTFHLIYIGDYKNDKKHGHGSYHNKDGSFYEGEFRNGKRHGFGRCWFADGSYYEGCWAENVRNGHGLFVEANGNRYEGEWNNGKKDGKGEFYHLAKAQRQIGFWKNEMCTMSKFEDLKFRQSAILPTPYPIQKSMLFPKVPTMTFIDDIESTIKGHHKNSDFLSDCQTRINGKPQ